MNHKGFSMIEIVVVVIVAGLIIVVISNIPSALSLIGSGSRDSEARQIIAAKVNDLRSKGYDNLANGTTQLTDIRLTDLQNASSTVMIQDCPSSVCASGEEVKYITINLLWKENGKSKSISTDTLISKGGLR